MDRERFRTLVVEALDEIPEPFLSRLSGVEIVVEDEPSAETLGQLGLHRRGDTVFGLYEGVPINERCESDGMMLPDRITIYYRPLVRTFRTPGAIRREIRKTVIHEVGHFFGLDDEDIEGEGW